MLLTSSSFTPLRFKGNSVTTLLTSKSASLPVFLSPVEFCSAGVSEPLHRCSPPLEEQLVPLGQPVSWSGCLGSPPFSSAFSTATRNVSLGFSCLFLKVSKLLSVLWGKEQTTALLSPCLSFLLRNFGFTLMLLEIMFSTV